MIAITFLVLLSTVSVLGWDDWQPWDIAGWTERRRLRGMANELVMEAKLRIKQLDGLKDEANPFTAFAVGTILGRIREKYRSMLELFRMTRNKHTGASKLNLPGIHEWRPLHYLIRLEGVRAIEVEIDQMVHMIESMDDDAPSFDLNLLIGKEKPRLSTTPESEDSGSN